VALLMFPCDVRQGFAVPEPRAMRALEWIDARIGNKYKYFDIIAGFFTILSVLVTAAILERAKSDKESLGRLLDSREQFRQYSTLSKNQSNMEKQIGWIEAVMGRPADVVVDNRRPTTEYLTGKLTSIERFEQDLQRLWGQAYFLESAQKRWNL